MNAADSQRDNCEKARIARPAVSLSGLCSSISRGRIARRSAIM